MSDWEPTESPEDAAILDRIWDRTRGVPPLNAVPVDELQALLDAVARGERKAPDSWVEAARNRLTSGT